MRFAVVEVMGHRLYAGSVEEATLAGAPILRVFIPYWENTRIERRYLHQPDPVTGLEGDVEREVCEMHEPQTVDLGGAAIFAVTWTSEARAMAVLRSGRASAGPAEGIALRTGPWRRPAEAVRQLPPPPSSEDDEDVGDGGFWNDDDEDDDEPADAAAP